jgi:Sulfotransferase domain
LPVFRFHRALDAARHVKAFLNPESSVTHSAAPEVEQDKKQDADPEKDARRRVFEQKELIRRKKQELHRIATRLRAAKERGEVSERIEQTKRAKRKKQEIFQLEMELRAAEGRPAPQAGSGKGALPDFAIIGPTKCGTTYLYHLLTQHPLVEPAAFKEPHYFNMFFEEESIEWYRRCFPAPRWKDGRKTITGEATPEYLVHPRVPERMAEAIPEARFIALLRNPVERTYSAYHHRVRNGQETRTFEEAVEQALEAQEARPLGEGGETLGRGDGAGSDDSRHKHLSNSIYVDYLLRWSKFFPREQMLVLKSEDFFDNPKESLKTAFDFLDLPDWEPGAWELGNKLNRGGYEQEMDPTIRRRLEAFFEPHNRRLYDYLGVDFGW